MLLQTNMSVNCRLKIKWEDESINDTFFYSLTELKSHIDIDEWKLKSSLYLLWIVSATLVIMVTKFFSNRCVFKSSFKKLLFLVDSQPNFIFLVVFQTKRDTMSYQVCQRKHLQNVIFNLRCSSEWRRMQIFKHFDLTYITSYEKVSHQYYVFVFSENILIFQKYTNFSLFADWCWNMFYHCFIPIFRAIFLSVYLKPL